MKSEIGIVITSVFLVGILAFGMFYGTGGFSGDLNELPDKITGFVIANETTPEVKDTISLDGENITKEEAQEEINRAEQIMVQMQESNFSVSLVNDTLLEAKRIFEQVGYAEILRGNIEATKKEKEEAERALKLIDWKDLSYDGILIYTEKISEIREKAILLDDKIYVEENNLILVEGELYSAGLFSGEGVETEKAKILLEEIKVAFDNERYDEVEGLLEELNLVIENERAKTSTLASLRYNSLNLFQRYWWLMLVLLICFVLIGYYIYKQMSLKFLKDKINKMKNEKEVLMKLMKRVQEERFKKNKISGLVYNIRMKKYEERLNEIKEELPVLESKLNKTRRNMKPDKDRKDDGGSKPSKKHKKAMGKSKILPKQKISIKNSKLKK